MAVPFRKTSKSKKNKRSAHFAIKSTTIVFCKNCIEPIHSHYICKSCGFHKNKFIVVSKKTKKAK